MMVVQELNIPGLKVKEHIFNLPLDYDDPSKGTIQVFGREVDELNNNKNKPWLVYLQGGPGFASPHPVSKSGWLKKMLNKYKVFFLDQRGTGKSSPISYQTLTKFKSPEASAEYLKHFRADNIVRDSESIRKELVGQKWSALGQSFGGFCIMSYLSQAPEGLSEAYITGGIPSLNRHIDDIYLESYEIVKERNIAYFRQFPKDRELINQIAEYIRNNEVYLPNGDRLSVKRFQCLGINFGYQQEVERMHYFFSQALIDGKNGTELSYNFLKGMLNQLSFDTNPIYSLLHEASYCQGFGSKWSAQRMKEEFPEFSDESNNILFTGEMVYPWFFDEFSELNPLKEVSEILADYEGWKPLYDIEKLKKNTVPIVAAVYYKDMYVFRRFSEETIELVPNIKYWITNEFEHCGLRMGGEGLIQKMFDLQEGEIKFEG